MTRNSGSAPTPVSDRDALLRLLPEQLPLIVYVYDLPERRNVFANRRFSDILGYKRGQAERVDYELLQAILHPDDLYILNEVRDRFRGIGDREIVVSEFRMRTAAGEWRWLRSRDIVFSRLPDGSPHLVLGTAEDITPEKQAAALENQHRQEIEREHHRLRELLELNERERRLVAYDIHDGFVQEVVSAQLAIDAMLDRLAVTDPDSVAPLLRVRAFVRKAIDESRRVVSDLRPATIEDRGLIEAIQFLVNEAEVAGRLDVKFSYPENFGRLDLLLERSLVRIAQESLTNVRRHAKTREADVRLWQEGNEIRLEIEDSGVGFDPAAVPVDRYGLEGIRQRVSVFSGITVIRSKPGQGTLVSVTVPVEPARGEPKPIARRGGERGAKPKRKRKKG